MLDAVIGTRHNLTATQRLMGALDQLNLDGTIYFGYPVVATISDERVTFDALLTCEQYGVVVFDFTSILDEDDVQERHDDLFSALFQRLIGYKPLRQGRILPFEINVVALEDPRVHRFQGGDLLIADAAGLPGVLAKFGPVDRALLQKINSVIQRITTIKAQRKRVHVKKPNSRGAVLKYIDRSIANLDSWQKHAAIETVDGPQSIRGLAGSGKTIVLALKAAYLHTQYPDWTIALTFYTRSLYQQFIDLVQRATFEHLNDQPDWEHLRVLHAWGSRSHAGVYAEIAKHLGIEPRTFQYASSKYGPRGAFAGICGELLDSVKPGADVEPLYDALLIDEAQDLPPQFFRLAWLVTKPPHRIVFAHDELQTLSQDTMATPAELFGNHPNGTPRVPNLENQEGAPQCNLVLPVCYRNTPWALTTAHAIGLGIYRKEGLVQFFGEPTVLEKTGYEVVSGDLSLGHDVTLRRKAESYPTYFEERIKPTDAVSYHRFENDQEQAVWLAKQIKRNLTKDELEHQDILVVVPDPLIAKTQASVVIEELAALNIPSHLAGVTSSVDELFQKDSVAISGIYRAKGNEAGMVYVIHAEYGVSEWGLLRRRNVLFTAFTRSRAWLRVCGVGDAMDSLIEEFKRIEENEYHLKFTVPTTAQLKELERVHREWSQAKVQKWERSLKGLKEIVAMIDKGDAMPEHVPPELLEAIGRLLRSRDANPE